MINKIRKTIPKKYDQIGAIFFAFLVHLSLLILLIWPDFDQSKPNFTVLEISMISSPKNSDSEGKSKKTTRHHHEIQSQKTSVNVHTHHDEKFAEAGVKSIELVHNPLPKIPDDLREEAFQSEAIARFYVDAAGNVEKVDLIKPCHNPRLNNLLLKALRQWKFSPNKIASTQDVKVRFRVE